MLFGGPLTIIPRMDRVPRPATSSTRRQRVREATAREIKSTARRLLVERGADGLTLRAIAREMGMTAPALYRYFPSREDLLEHVIAELYDDVTGALEAARDELADADMVGRMLAVSRMFRRWALDHPGEFGLLFGSPITGTSPSDPGDRDDGPAHEAGRRFGMLFGVLVGLLYQRQPFPIRSDEEIEPVLAARLREWCDDFPVRLPLGVLQVFLSCWIRLYGAVCLEVFGHLRFAVEDAEPMFETELQSLAGLLGARYRPPVAAATHGAA